MYKPSQQSSPLDMLELVLTSTFISDELLLRPSVPLFILSFEMTTISDPFLPPPEQAPPCGVPFFPERFSRRTTNMATTVNTRPPIIPDSTITVGTVAENKIKTFIKRWSVAESFAIFENHDYIYYRLL